MQTTAAVSRCPPTSFKQFSTGLKKIAEVVITSRKVESIWYVCDPSKLLFPAGFGVLTFYLAQATGTLICQYDVRMFCCVTHSCVEPFSRYSCDIGPVLLGKSFPKPFFPFPHFLM